MDLHSDKVRSWVSNRVTTLAAEIPIMKTGATKAPLGLTIPLKQLNRKWKKFKRKYRSDEQCIEGIILLGGFDTRNCKECGFKNVITRAHGSKIVQCRKCSAKYDLFAGTFFQRMRRVFAYFAAFWFVKQNIGISDNFFAELAGIAQSTAHGIFKKIDTVILDLLMEDAVNADADLFAEVFSKRSSETPARVEPSKERSAKKMEDGNEVDEADEVDEVDEADEVDERDKEVERDEVDDLPDNVFVFLGQTAFPIADQKKVLRAMSEQPISFDNLRTSTGFAVGELGGILNWLELTGLIAPAGGNSFKRTGKVGGIDKIFPIDEAKLQKFFEHVRHVFHGVSRKHLQKFLARFWAFICEKFHNTDLLIRICAKHDYIDQASIRKFVTPDVVKVLFI